MRHPSSLLLAVSLLATALLCACQHVDERVSATASVLRQRWRELATRPPQAPKTLSWAEAVKKLETGNLKLLKARESIWEAREAERQVPRDYIPELSLSTFANPTFNDLGEGDLGSTYLFLGSLFNIPNPLHYRAMAVQARLRYLSAQIDCETLRRNLYVKLYKAFRKAEHLAGQDAQYQALAKLDHASKDHPFTEQLAAMKSRNQQAWEKLSADLGDLFGDYSRRWRPATPARLPNIDYADHPPALTGDNHFAALQITKAALQLVVLEAQRQGLLAGEWPQLSVFLSAPPIYQRSSGQESYLSLKDIRLSGFVSYSSDFRGTRSLARKQTARRTALMKKELDVAMQATIRRLRDALALDRKLATRLKHLRQARHRLHASGDFAAADNLRGQIKKLQDQIDDLNLSFWVLDESRWNHQP